jgi:hypothetical protein
MRGFVNSSRIGIAVLLSSVLLAGGCGFEAFVDDVLRSEEEPARATAPPTNTPWSYSTPSATPMPTNTPWTWRPSRPAATSTPTSRPTPSPTPSPTPVPVVNLLGCLPAMDDVPAGLRLDDEDATLSIDEVAGEVEDAAGYRDLLADWGYRGGSARQFSLPDPGLRDFLTRMLALEARALEFASAAAAGEAIAFQRDYAKQRPGWRLKDVAIDPLGDATYALSGTADYEGTEVSVAAIFIQDGNRVLRFVGIAGRLDPLDDTIEIARASSC